MVARWSCLLAALALLHARDAAACTPDPCAEVLAFVGLEPANDDPVPTDGVLILKANWFGELGPEPLLAGLTLTVQQGDDVLDGALEPTDLVGVLVWRPAAPLAPAATHRVTATFTNPDGVPSVCAAPVVDVAFEFLSADGPALPLVNPTLYASERLTETPQVNLDTIVCCDDAYPRQQEYCGISHGLVWSRGQCASMLSLARVRLDINSKTNLDVPTAGQLVRTLYQDGEATQSSLGGRFGRSIDRPTCFAIAQTSLATGETLISDEVCLGEGFADAIGDAPQDPWLALAGRCDGEPYTCDVVDGAWDKDACTPFEAPSNIHNPAPGCNCNGAPATPLLALPLLALARRRRVSRG
jgi:uncharacterized protein (TIGR03382 family)